MFYHKDDEGKKLCQECKHSAPATDGSAGSVCTLFTDGAGGYHPSTTTARTAAMLMCDDDGSLWERKTNS